MASKRSRLAIGLALALLASACGDGDAATLETTTAIPATTVATTVAPTTTTTSTTTSSTTTAPTTTTTTSTVPPLDAEAVAFIEDWVSLMNGGDHATGAEMLIAAGQYDSPGDDETRTFFEIWVLLDSQFELGECRTLSSGITRCWTERQVELSPHAPHPETFTLSARFDDDGSLAYTAITAVQSDPWFRGYIGFKQWTLDTYGTGPDSPYTNLFTDVTPDGYAELLAEQIAIWEDEAGA